MTFLTPLFLAGGAAVATAIVLLHFLARRRPPPAVLPTARFVPDRPARWPSRAPRPTDWVLLALRAASIALIAAAFARPVRESERALIARIVLVDRSRSVADERAMKDSALAVLREGDIAIAFDTIARTMATSPRESVAVLTRSTAEASLSVALIAAERAAGSLRDRADSIELVLVSPVAEHSWDDATIPLRTRLPGRMRLIAIPLAKGDTTSATVELRAPVADPIRAAAAPFLARSSVRARIVRERPSAADSSWAATGGHVLVDWPRASATAEATAQGVVAPNVVLAAPLVRRPLAGPSHIRIVARFADGAAAVVERAHGDGCIREIGFDLPAAGDVPLRESTRRLVGLFVAPCERDAPTYALGAARLDSLRGTGALLATAALPRRRHTENRWPSWLLIAGAVLLLAEVAVRQRTVRT